MFTVVYMSESGKLEEKKFNSLEAAQAFCRDESKKVIPTIQADDGGSKAEKMKTRVEELDLLISELKKTLSEEEKLKFEKLLTLELERNNILK